MSAGYSVSDGAGNSMSDLSKDTILHRDIQHLSSPGFGHRDTKNMLHHKLYLGTSSTIPFLFEGWSLQSVEGLLGALLVTVAMSVLREILVQSTQTRGKIGDHQRQCNPVSLSKHIRTSVLYMINTGLAFILMLTVMTYNIWLLVVVALGAGLGYFFFRPFIEWANARASVGDRHQVKNAYASVPIDKFGDKTSFNKIVVETKSRCHKNERVGKQESQTQKPLLL